MQQSSTPLTFDRITPSACGRHAVVRLRNAEGTTRVNVRVSHEYACAIAATGSGLPSVPSGVVDALLSCAEACGGVPVGLVLPQESERALMRIRTNAGEGETLVPVEPGAGILVACHLRLAVVLAREARESAAAAFPSAPSSTSPDALEAYREAVDTIEWFDDAASRDAEAGA